jgi:hypothetical protein
MVNAVRSITINSSARIRVNRDASGTTLDIKIPNGGGMMAGGLSSGREPFEIYQQGATTPNPTSDWRTFRVHRGAFNFRSPDNDDAATTPLEIVVPAASLDFPVILRVVRGDESGSIDEVTIVAPDSDDDADIIKKWPDYDKHNWPSNVIHYLIGTITVGNDTTTSIPPSDDPDYHSVTIQQELTRDIVDFKKEEAFAPGLIYQYLDASGDFTTGDWRTVAVASGIIVGTEEPSNIGTAISLAESATTHVWLEVVLSGAWAVSTVAINSGTTLPDQPTVDSCDTPPTDPFIIHLGTVTTTADSTIGRQLSFTQLAVAHNGFSVGEVLTGIAWDGDISDFMNVRERTVMVNGIVIAQSTGGVCSEPAGVATQPSKYIDCTTGAVSDGGIACDSLDAGKCVS